jgi:hypothetical protein
MIGTTSWDDVDTQLDVFLEDSLTADQIEEGTAKKYSVPQRVDAWNWSQRQFAVQHTPRQVRFIPAVDNGSRALVLPGDFLGIWRIYDSDANKWMREMRTPKTGGVRISDDSLSQYWVWGKTLYLEMDADASQMVLYYWAYWPEVTYRLESSTYVILESDVIVPSWTVLPICHLTASVCLQPGAIQAARSRNYNIEVDSGRPVDNSRAQQAKEHWWWWQELLKKVAPANWREGALSG